MIDFKPTRNRVLIEPLTEQYAKAGRFHIPENHREMYPTEGIVVALGTKGPFEVKIGDRIIMEAHHGTAVTIQGKTFKILATNEILAIIE